MPSTRRRALKLRSRNVPIKGRKGRTDPLTQVDHARASLNNLTLSLPPNRSILVPRTWQEAHNRPDSLCAVLGIPFAELGPLLLTAGILVKSNLRERLSFSLEGFQRLIDLYKRTPANKLGLEKRRPALKAWTADRLVDTENPPYFYYVFRGSRKPSAYEYIPLHREDVVVSVAIKIHLQEKHSRAQDLGRGLHQSFNPDTAALFAESRQPTTTQSFTSTPAAATDTTAAAEDDDDDIED